MQSDDQFAQWAALFVKNCAEDETGASQALPPVAGDGGLHYAGVTQAAAELLQAVDAGGVPAFVTSQLKQIASDNGIDVTAASTPNEIVDAIRAKARALAAGKPAGDSTG